jgi:hypothetical protein
MRTVEDRDGSLRAGEMRSRIPLALGLALAFAAPALGGIRKQCKQSCGSAINACIASYGGMKRHKCTNQVRARCRKQGIEVCVAPPTTTTTTTTIPPLVTTTLPNGIPTTTTTLPQVSTTTTTTTLPYVTTTTTNLPTTTTTTRPPLNYNGQRFFDGFLTSNTCPITTVQVSNNGVPAYELRGNCFIFEDSAGSATMITTIFDGEDAFAQHVRYQLSGGVSEAGSVDPLTENLTVSGYTDTTIAELLGVTCDVFAGLVIEPTQVEITIPMVSAASLDLRCTDSTLNCDMIWSGTIN